MNRLACYVRVLSLWSSLASPQRDTFPETVPSQEAHLQSQESVRFAFSREIKGLRGDGERHVATTTWKWAETAVDAVGGVAVDCPASLSLDEVAKAGRDVTIGALNLDTRVPCQPRFRVSACNSSTAQVSRVPPTSVS
ncbi:unnamed protein product [Lota lota]